jgi:putative addiction module antidote
MNVTIRKIGNSEGVIIPKDVLERLGLKAGDSLDLEVGADQMVLKAIDEDIARQMEHAEKFMEKYKVALQKLAE